MSHLSPLAPKSLTSAAAATANTFRGNGGGGQGKSSDPRIYVPTEQEEKELIRKIELAEKRPPRPFGSMPEENSPSISYDSSLSPAVVRLAKAPGSTPLQRSARMQVAEDYYKRTLGLGSERFRQDRRGIDLNEPVEVIKYPPPDTMTQHMRTGGKRVGNFFDPVGSQHPESLGISGEGRETVVFKTATGEGLCSTAAPILDNWTNNTNPVLCGGGGGDKL